MDIITNNSNSHMDIAHISCYHIDSFVKSTRKINYSLMVRLSLIMIWY